MGVFVYLAGKIGKNDWRNSIVNLLRGHAVDAMDVVNGKPASTIIEGLYTVGPFFISCDHGCFHGEKSHGVAANSEPYCGPGIPAEIVPIVCKEQIERSQFLFALIEDKSCYGTLCEIGYAVGIGKPVAVMFTNKRVRSDMWFVAEMADIEFDAYGDVAKANAKDAVISMMARKIAYNLARRKEEE